MFACFVLSSKYTTVHIMFSRIITHRQVIWYCSKRRWWNGNKKERSKADQVYKRWSTEASRNITNLCAYFNVQTWTSNTNPQTGNARYSYDWVHWHRIIVYSTLYNFSPLRYKFTACFVHRANMLFVTEALSRHASDRSPHKTTSDQYSYTLRRRRRRRGYDS